MDALRREAVGATEVVSWEGLLAAPEWRSHVALDVTLPAVPARVRELPGGLHPQVRRALMASGISGLYSHQAEAAAWAMAGRDTVVATPTASGKSLCYQLPVLDALARDPDATAILLFPTKALAQDQLASFRELGQMGDIDLRTFTYDGDTPGGVRTALRQQGNVVLTNPDMLHGAILPGHPQWARLFRGLRYVVVDELHSYRGVFGSHVANVIRRLERVCRFYGSRPVYICCSATIANPEQLASQLLGRDVGCVTDSGAPMAERRFVVLNPPMVDKALGVRRSPMQEARRFLPAVVRSGAQTIVFANSRLQVELLRTYLAQSLDKATYPVSAYRSGYLPLERRQLEQSLRAGQLRCVVATSALELGIDVGGLDAAVLIGYPGSIASTWQRLGRAGRRDIPALQVLITGGGPLDQYLARNPEFLLHKSPEAACIDPDNLLILAAHLQAAVFELPLADGELFGDSAVGGLLEVLREDGLIHRAGGDWHWSSDAFPAGAINLRTTAASNVVILDTTSQLPSASLGPQGSRAGSGGGRAGEGAKVVGEVDSWAAPFLVHDDAIYLHQGRQYHVERLDWEEHRAYVHPVSVDYYTDAQVSSSLQVLEQLTRGVTTSAGVVGYHGEVRVSVLAAMYRKIRLLTHETVGAGPIWVPERDLQTTAYWCRFPRPAGAVMDLSPGIEALGHALRELACLLTMCDSRDLGVSVRSRWAGSGLPSATARASVEEFLPGDGAVAAGLGRDEDGGPDGPSVFIYDMHPGGVGLSAKLFDLHHKLLPAAERLFLDCPCEGGCPGCVGPVAGLRTPAKRLALQLLGVAG